MINGQFAHQHDIGSSDKVIQTALQACCESAPHRELATCNHGCHIVRRVCGGISSCLHLLRANESCHGQLTEEARASHTCLVGCHTIGKVVCASFFGLVRPLEPIARGRAASANIIARAATRSGNGTARVLRIVCHKIPSTTVTSQIGLKYQ